MPLCPAPVLRWFIPAQPGTGGGLVPAAGYKFKFYEPGTLDPATIYTDAALSVPYPAPSNTAVLDSEGKALVYLENGKTYDARVYNASDVFVYGPIEGILGSGSLGMTAADSFADLQTADTSYKYCYIPGYYAAGDGGQGVFYIGANTAPDGGYIQSSTFDPSKSWYRIPDEDGFVRAASFGFDQSSGSNFTTQMQAADAYCVTNSRPLLIDVGSSTAELGAMTFNAPRVVFVGRGIKGLNTVPAITFNSLVEGTPEFLFERMTVTLNNKAQKVYPEWWNAAGDGATDDLAKLNAMFASGAKEFFLLDKDYEVTAAPTLPATGTIKSLGTITEGGGPIYHVKPGVWVLNSVGLIKAQDLESVNNVTAGLDVIAGNDITADRHLTAGEGSGAGHVKFKAGTGTVRPFAVGRYGQNLGSASTSGTVETDLLSVNIVANSLVNNGDSLLMWTSLDFPTLSSGAAPVIRVYLDTLVIFTYSYTQLSVAFKSVFQLRVWKAAANSVKAHGVILNNYDAAEINNVAFGSGAVTLTSDALLKVTGEEGGTGLGGAITQEGMFVNFERAV